MVFCLFVFFFFFLVLLSVMDLHANQHDSLNRADHPPELRAANAAAACSDIEALSGLDPRISLQLYRGDITKAPVDVVVNSANETLQGGGGIDEAIHLAAGEELRNHCKGMFCATGDAVLTPGFKLKKMICHTVAPFLDAKGNVQPDLLKMCYISCLQTVWRKKKNVVKSISFPTLGTGYYGFPALDAARIAITTISDWLQHHKDWDISVVFCVLNDVDAAIYGKLMKPGSMKPRGSLFRHRRPAKRSDEQVCVLVIDESPQNDWYSAFRGSWPGGVRVEQTSWRSIGSCKATRFGGLELDLEASSAALFGTSMGSNRSVIPDVILVRNFAKSAKNDLDYKNLLFAFAHANVPCVNSVEMLIKFVDRANAISFGHKIQDELIDDFQMIPIDFFSNVGELDFGKQELPVVAKVGSSHSGHGKMKFSDAGQLSDFRGLVCLSRDYLTLEPFLENKKFEYRLQSMGGVLRCFSRESLSHDWKANVGEGQVFDLEITSRHCRIAAAIGEHLDIWGADFIVCGDGQEFCLEINDSSIGFVDEHKKKDMQGIVQCVMKKLKT